MVPRMAFLLRSSFLLTALISVCSAGRPRLLQEAALNGSAPNLAANLPPDVNLTAIAESLPEDTKPEDLAALAAAGSLPILANLPPDVNWTLIAESLPEDTKPEDLVALAALAKQEDLAALANGQNKTDLSALAGVALPKMDFPDLPNVSLPDLELPPIPSPKITVFGHEFTIPLDRMLGGGHS